MKLIRKPQWQIVGIVCLAFLVVVGIFIRKENRSEDHSGIPDVMSSVNTNTHDYLTVTANTDSITDKEEFANRVIQMYLENSFHSVKLSEENGYPNTLSIDVYLHRESIKNEQPVLQIQLEPDDLNAGYNIKDDKGHYTLRVNDEIVNLL